MKTYLFTMLATLMALASAVQADDFIDALKGGTTSLDTRLRYETVSNDELSQDDATALTIRNRLGYQTGGFHGFSYKLELDHTSVIFDQDEFAPETSGFAVIADQTATEVDQSYLQYQREGLTIKAGRQVIALGNQRFVGHVGWRQDRQTFDALSLNYQFGDLGLTYAFVNAVNGINGDRFDKFTEDHLLNVSYKTPVGNVAAYAYLLEDNDTKNTLDTYGLSLDGSKNLFVYALEFASQTADVAGAEADTTYMKLEIGAKVSGITVKLGREILGSDDGSAAFQTPYATKHKFNGWADQFLTTPNEGLEDIYLSVAGKVSGVKLVAAWHDYSADDASATVDELGSEINLLAARKFGKHYNAGIKYAQYSADDSKVDTDKLWVWGGLSF